MTLETDLSINNVFYKKYFSPSDELVNICYGPFCRKHLVTFNKKSKTATPTKKFIEIGISNDALTEIISGLNEGDEVIARTILATAKTGTPQAPSLFGGNTSRGTGTSGNTFKIPR